MKKEMLDDQSSALLVDQTAEEEQGEQEIASIQHQLQLARSTPGEMAVDHPSTDFLV